MTPEEFFVLTIFFTSAVLAVGVYVQVKTGWPKPAQLGHLRAGWALFSASSLFLCGFRFLRFDNSDRVTTLTVIAITFPLSLFGIYKCLFPVREKKIDDSKRLERYREDFKNKKQE